MRPGGGKGKGAAFERAICKQLSLWITNGKKTDCFWRSAISGGRATVRHRKGESTRQAGDICAVSPEAHAFTDKWFVECKHVRRLNIEGFLLSNKGDLAKFWKVAKQQAARHDRWPMIIARQNNSPILVITPLHGLSDIEPKFVSVSRECDVYLFEDMLEAPPI